VKGKSTHMLIRTSIIYSHHSGAGKTVSATHIMRYFATADDKESGKVKDVSQGMTEVEEQIMGK
jgi:myosin-5